MTQERGISPFGLELLGKLNSSEIKNAFRSKGWAGHIKYLGPVVDLEGKDLGGETVGVERSFPMTKEDRDNNCVANFVWIRRYEAVPDELVIISNAEPFVVDMSQNDWLAKLEEGIKKACDKPGCYLNSDDSRQHSKFEREERELVR